MFPCQDQVQQSVEDEDYPSSSIHGGARYQGILQTPDFSQKSSIYNLIIRVFLPFFKIMRIVYYDVALFTIESRFCKTWFIIGFN